MSKAVLIVTSSIITAALYVGQASADVTCLEGGPVPVKGKITNMAVSPQE